MTVKAIVDVDVNDAAFTKFHELFKKYTEALAKTPGDWAKVDKASAGTALTVESLVAGLAAHNESVKRALSDQKKLSDEAKRRAAEEKHASEFWARSASSAKSLAKSVGGITLDLFKWGGIAAAFTGIAGAGAFFGLDGLALGAGAGRRASQGIGARYGERQSFVTNYDRLVDAGGVLSGVNESLTDVSKRYSLYGAGLSESQIAGKDTAQVAALLIPALKQIADRTPTGQLAQVIAARGLGNLGIGVQDLERLKGTSKEELAGIGARYGAGVGAFDLQDATARKWQDLGITLSAAKLSVENALIKGLTGLTGPLEKFTGSVVKAVTSFFANPNLQKDVESFGKGIEAFAKYLGSPKFHADVKTFADDISYAAGKLASVARFLGLLPDKPVTEADAEKALGPNSAYGPGGAKEQAGDKFVRGLAGSLGLGPGRNNPGNLRNWTGIGFQNFDSPDQGIRAVGDQLKRYEYGGKFGHLDTVAKIIATYAPKKDGNDVAAYVRDVVSRTGLGANEHLELNNSAVLAKLVAAILKHENKKNNVTADMVLKIINNTGGSAVVSASQLGR